MIEFIGERFLKASKGGGLDRAFGFTAVGKGKRTPPTEQQRIDKRNHMWCLDFFKLQAAGLAPSTAARAIAGLWQKRTGETLTGAAVLNAVKASESRYALEREHVLAAGRAWTIEEKRELLRSVNAVDLPRKIRKHYGL